MSGRSRFLKVVLASALMAPAAAAAPPEGAQAGPKHCLWRVRSATNTVYLLGSIHIMRPDGFPLAVVIESAFAIPSQPRGHAPEVGDGLIDTGKLLFDFGDRAVLVFEVRNRNLELTKRLTRNRLERRPRSEIVNEALHCSERIEQPPASHPRLRANRRKPTANAASLHR